VLVKVDAQGAKIRFTVPEAGEAPQRKFTGQVSAKGLSGRFEDALKPQFLNRKKSSWQ